MDGALAKKLYDPKRCGTDSSAGGRPRSSTRGQTERLLSLVFQERDKARVTARYCRLRLPFLRLVLEEIVRQAAVMQHIVFLMLFSAVLPSLQEARLRPTMC